MTIKYPSSAGASWEIFHLCQGAVKTLYKLDIVSGHLIVRWCA